MVATNGYNYTYLVEFTSIPTDYLPYYPPTRTGGSAGPSMLPFTWAMVTLSTCHVIRVAPPTQPSQRPRRHLPPIMWVTEAPPTLSHAYVDAWMRHGSYPCPNSMAILCPACSEPLTLNYEGGIDHEVYDEGAT